MSTPTWRVVVVGAVMGVVAVAAFVVAALTGVLPGARPVAVPLDQPVLVMLVMPDANGVVVPRVIDLYSPLGAVTQLRSVDPSMPATVAGTTAQTLAEAYSYGGGGGVASAYATGAGVTQPAWVVIGPDAWLALVPGASLRLDLPSDMQVFDGTRLYAFSAGSGDVPTAETAQLFDGAAYLAADQQSSLRSQVGDAMESALASATPAQAANVQSAFPAGELQTWIGSLGSIHRVQGP